VDGEPAPSDGPGDPDYSVDLIRSSGTQHSALARVSVTYADAARAMLKQFAGISRSTEEAGVFWLFGLFGFESADREKRALELTASRNVKR